MSVLRRGGAISVKTWGVSMLPAVWPGDVLTIRGAQSTEIAPGDIVLVLRKDRIFIHRLVSRHDDPRGPWWITKGDAMDHNDPPVAASDLLGRVVSIRRRRRDLLPSRQVSRARALVGLLACRSGRFRSILLRIHAMTAPPASLDDSFAAPSGTMPLSSDDCDGRCCCP